MKRICIVDLEDQLARHLRSVERGEEIEVIDRDRPIARIVPISDDGAGVEIVPASASPREFRARRPRPARWPIDSVELLLRKRREG